MKIGLPWGIFNTRQSETQHCNSEQGPLQGHDSMCRAEHSADIWNTCSQCSLTDTLFSIRICLQPRSYSGLFVHQDLAHDRTKTCSSLFCMQSKSEICQGAPTWPLEMLPAHPTTELNHRGHQSLPHSLRLGLYEDKTLRNKKCICYVVPYKF